MIFSNCKLLNSLNMIPRETWIVLACRKTLVEYHRLLAEESSLAVPAGKADNNRASTTYILR